MELIGGGVQATMIAFVKPCITSNIAQRRRAFRGNLTMLIGLLRDPQSHFERQQRFKIVGHICKRLLEFQSLGVVYSLVGPLQSLYPARCLVYRADILFVFLARLRFELTHNYCLSGVAFRQISPSGGRSC